MEHPTPQQLFLARLSEFTISIKLLLDPPQNLPGNVTLSSLPALVMLYSAIDILGSLLRPESEADTRGEYFKKWVDDYMIGHSQVAFTSDDLWGARCGMLHTHTASSKLARAGKARRLHYLRTHGASLPPAMKAAMNGLSAQGKVFVDVDSLCSAFEEGTRRFLVAIQSDATLEKRVRHHSSHLFGVWRNFENK
jgi:hypothetical protein